MGNLCIVFLEHLQIQVVPVPNNVAPNLKDAFLVCSSIFKSKFIQKDRYLTLLIYYALVFFLINLQVKKSTQFDIQKGFIEFIFLLLQNSAESCSLDLDEIPKHSDITQIAPPGSPFFYLELPNGDKMYHRIRKGFPLQFGRYVYIILVFHITGKNMN